MGTRRKKIWVDTKTGEQLEWKIILSCVAESLGLPQNARISKMASMARSRFDVNKTATDRNVVVAVYELIKGTKIQKRRPRKPKTNSKRQKSKIRRQTSALGFANIKRQNGIRRIPCDEYDSFFSSRAWRELRYLALKNTDGRCECCGASAKDGVQLHVDHILPRSARPDLALALDNLQVLCVDCNIGKGAWDDTDWRAKV